MTAGSAFKVRASPSAKWQIGTGAAAGALATLVFMVVHHILIMPIWFMVVPMLAAGAICGLTIAWSYLTAVDLPSTGRWFALNGAYLLTMFALGIVSLIGFEPAWTFAELNVEDPPIGELFSRALPLMIGFSLVGALPIWVTFGRKRSAFVPIIVTEAVLVLLLGHNVAIIGLVDLTTDGWSLVWIMFGLVAFLAAANALTYLGLSKLRRL